jgi:tryptophan-rich sensory protein
VIRGWRSLVGLVVWVLVAFLPSLGGLLAMPDAWYARIAKPPWNPPSWVFGPVWTLLYLSMGVAAWLVWRHGGLRAQAWPLSVFAVQLALNAAWSPLFFGLHRPGLALVDIVAMLVAIASTIRAFRAVQPAAGLLLVPYLAWVSFATVLNGTIWWLDRGSG